MGRYLIITREYIRGSSILLSNSIEEIIDSEKNRLYDGAKDEKDVRETYQEYIDLKNKRNFLPFRELKLIDRVELIE